MPRKKRRRKDTLLDEPDGALNFARKMRGLKTLIPFQTEVLRKAWTEPLLAVASGHGMGKGYVGGLLALAFGCILPKPKVIITAPTGRQAKKTLWAELQAHHEATAQHVFVWRGQQMQADFSKHSLNESDWKIGKSEVATHFAVRPSEQTAFQGLHAPQMLIMIDEAAGVDDRIVEAAMTLGTGKNSRVVLLGNPTNPGIFEDAFQKGSGWATISASCFEHPNVLEGLEHVPGAVTRQWIDQMWARHGDGEPIRWPEDAFGKPTILVRDSLQSWPEWARLVSHDNMWWQGHVMGRFPQEGENNLIKHAWVVDACGRWFDDPGPTTMGVDIARYGKDLTVLVVAQSRDLIHMEEHSRTSGKDVVGLVHMTAREYGVDPRNIKIDATGIGGMGVGDWLDSADGLTEEQRMVWRQVDEVVFSAGADDERFMNKRAELIWSLRDRLQSGALGMKKLSAQDRETLEHQLRSLKFEFRQKGKIAVEAKDDYRKRTGGSPDHAEALALAFFGVELDAVGKPPKESSDAVLDRVGVHFVDHEVKKPWFGPDEDELMEMELEKERKAEEEAEAQLEAEKKAAEDAKTAGKGTPWVGK